MADLFLSKVADLTTTNATTVYTVPTSSDSAVPRIYPTTAIIKSIHVANDSGSDDTITLTITRGSDVYAIETVKAVAANTAIEVLTQPMVLSEADIIKATAATANRLHVILSVMEIT